MGEEHAFTSSLVNSLKSSGKKRTCSRGELLLKEGEIEKNLYYIESGAVRVFLLSAHEAQTIRLGYEGSIIYSLSSFLKGNPSEFYVEAIRKTTLKVLSKTALSDIVNKNIESLNGYNSLLETVIAQQMEREIDLLTISPAERLQRVLQRSPNLFQHIPLKYIAAYLRMTPETLSRIRKS